MLVDQHIVNINKQIPWPSCGVVVVAVSGGPDSVCTLRVCHELAQLHGFSIHVAHLDHGLRGEESQADAIFTKKLAESLGWPVTCAYRDVKHLHGYTGSLQQRCRSVRQDFLDQVIEDQRAVAIVYGHNLDDQAETVLQHLMRGSGLQGLTGMRQFEEKEGVLVLRPLLTLSRAEIIELLAEWKQSFRNDPSNETDHYQRNHIRHHLLPYLRESYNPQITQRLADMANTIGHDEDLLRNLTKQVMSEVLHLREDMLSINRPALLKQPQALQLRVMRSTYQILHGSTEDLTFFHTEQMVEMLHSEHGMSISLPNGITCAIIYTDLCLFYTSDMAEHLAEKELLRPLSIPGITSLSEGKSLKAVILEHCDQTKSVNGCAKFDLEKLKMPLSLRYRKPGDRFYPFKAPGSKKLKDFLIDYKMPRHLRNRQLLLVDSADTILWIIGIRRSNYAIISTNTKITLELSIGDEQL